VDGLLMRLVPKNWAQFQHYKDRCPPWIKLHRDILNDRAFMLLPTASKALAPLLWLLASESKSEQGDFDASTEELEFRLRMTAKEIDVGLRALIDKGFFIVASGALADRKQPAIPETEESRGEREAKGRRFDAFWSAYPRKVAKDDARKAFEKRDPDDELLAVMVSALNAQALDPDWQKEKGKFVPHPATWLNGARWTDEVGQPAQAGEVGAFV
jgi:hypothetical protein